MSTLPSLLNTLLACNLFGLPAEHCTSADETTGRDTDAATFVGYDGERSVYEFPDEELPGELLSADGTLILYFRYPYICTFYSVRDHFTPEMTRLVSEL